MPRSRIIISWVVFGLGVVAILFGGYGLLTHSPWSDTVNSLCTIFGTMMSFSQFFVGFPTTLKLSRDKVAPASPIVSPQRLGTAPPYPHSAPTYPPPPSSYYAQPPQFSISPSPSVNMRKLYRRSGIALLLAAPCVFIEALASFNSPSTLTGTLIGLIFNVFEGILVLIALRGFYMKQAQQAGWIGTLSIIVIAAAYITLVVGASFLIYFILNLPYTLNQVNSLTFLAQLNGIFIVVGYILLGFAIFRAGVYPSWTGVTIIALGLYNVIPTLINFLAPTQQSTAALTFEGFLSGMANLILGVLYVRWSIALLKK